MTPNPPAFVTAAANSGPAATFILNWSARLGNCGTIGDETDPASRIGCLIPKSCVMGVEIVDIVGMEVVGWLEGEPCYIATH